MNEKMNLNNVSKRLYKWDNLKALLIFLVVVGHLIDRANQKSDLLMKINYWIYVSYASIHLCFWSIQQEYNS